MAEKEAKELDLNSIEKVERPEVEEEKSSKNNTIGLLMNVELELSAILGFSELPFKKVLELTKGSIVELDKLTNEPIDLYVNDKLIAKGEVVIIEDNFGLRVTETIDEDIIL